MKTKNTKLKIIFLTSVLISGAAMADSVLTYNTADGNEHSKMYLADGMAKMTNNTDANTALLYNTQNNSFTVLNHTDKSYMVFGEKEIAALGDISSMIDRMVEEQLAQMPASQREQMRGMIKSMMEKQMPKSLPAPVYEKTGKTQTYNGFVCEEAIQKVDGKKMGSFCVASHQSLGVDSKDYASISEFMKIAEKMASQFGQNQSMNLDTLGQVLPVYYDMGTEKGYLTDVQHGDIAASEFEIPAGYTKESLPKEMFQ